jgi:hypothetical protein
MERRLGCRRKTQAEAAPSLSSLSLTVCSLSLSLTAAHSRRRGHRPRAALQSLPLPICRSDTRRWGIGAQARAAALGRDVARLGDALRSKQTALDDAAAVTDQAMHLATQLEAKFTLMQVYPNPNPNPNRSSRTPPSGRSFTAYHHLTGRGVCAPCAGADGCARRGGGAVGGGADGDEEAATGGGRRG